MPEFLDVAEDELPRFVDVADDDEEFADAAERRRMLEYARRRLKESSIPDVKTWGVEVGTGLASRASRLVGEDKAADWYNRFGSAYGQAMFEIEQGGAVPPIIRRGLRGAAQTVPEMIVAGAVGGPYAAIGSAVSQEANQAITEGRDVGLKGQELAGYVATQGVVEAAPAIIMQRFGLGGLESAVGRGASQAAAQGVWQGLKQAGIQTLQEVPEEIVTELGHSVAGSLSGVRPEALKPDQIQQTMLDTTVQTLATMGLVEAPLIAQAATAGQTVGQIAERVKAGGTVSRKEARDFGFDKEVVADKKARTQKFVDDIVPILEGANVPEGLEGMGSSQAEAGVAADPGAGVLRQNRTPGGIGEAGGIPSPTPPLGMPLPGESLAAGAVEPPADAAQPEGREGVKQPWEMTQAEFAAAYGNNDPGDWASVIRRNQSSGKQIPPAVQADLDSYDARKTKKPEQKTAPAKPGDTVVRYTHADGTGLLNNQGLDRSKLSDDEEAELLELMDFGLQQPPEGTTGTFYFTQDGEKKHARLLELLSKASKSGVVRTESILQSQPGWESTDGQIAATASRTPPEAQKPPAAAKPTPEPTKPVETPPGAPGDTTSIKNAKMAELAAQIGLEPVEEASRQSVQQWLDEATQRMTADPSYGEKLVLKQLGKPGSLDEVETAAYQILIRQRKSDFDEAVGRIEQTADDPVAAAEAGTELAIAKARIDQLKQVGKTSGTAWGRTGVARKIELEDDFSVAAQVRRRMDKNGGQVPSKEEFEEFRKKEAEYQEREAEVRQRMQEYNEDEVTKSLDAVIAEAVKARPKEIETLDDRAPKDWARETLARRAEGLGIHVGGRNKTRLIRLINEVEGPLREAAEKNEIPYRVFLKGIEASLPEAKEYAEGKRRAKTIAQKAMGLTPKQIEALENGKKDKASVLNFDDVLQNLLADPDVAPYISQTWDHEDDLWNLLKEPNAPENIWANSPEVIERALGWVRSNPDVTEESLGPEVEVQAQFVGETPKTRAKPREKSERKQAVEKKIADVWAEFKTAQSNWARGASAGSLNVSPVELLGPAVKVIKAYVELGYVNLSERFSAFWEDHKNNLGTDADSQREVFQQAWKTVRAENREDTDIDPDIPIDEQAQEISDYAQEVMRDLTESGVTDRNEIWRAVHEELQQVIPGITYWESGAALAKAGLFRPLPKDELSRRERALRGEVRTLVNIKHVKREETVPPSGIEMPEPSDEQRRFAAVFNNLKKKATYLAKDRKRHLKSAQETLVKHLTNRIKDVTHEIDKRQPIVKVKNVTEETDEIRALRAELAELLKTRRTIFPKQKPTEAQRAAAMLKGLDRSIALAQADVDAYMQTGKIGPKAKSKERKPTSLEIKDRQATLTALKSLKEEILAIENPKMSEEERSNLAYKRLLEKKREDYRRRIRDKDFSKKPKVERKLPPDLLKTKHAFEKTKQRFKRDEQRWERQQQSTLKKVASAVPASLDLMRAFKTSFDISAPGRQGAVLGAAHPKLFAESIAPMFKAMVSERGQFEAIEWLDRSDPKGLRKKAGLAVTTTYGKLVEQEEAYMGNLSRYIPGVAMSERAYVTFLSVFRAQVFDSLSADLSRTGEVTPEEAKIIANWVNVATGRGSFGAHETATVLLARVFFSPRFVMSRFQLLIGQPLWTGAWKGKGTWRVRRLMAKEYGKSLGGYVTFYGMLALLSALLYDDDDPEKPTVSWDPRSSDFGKVKIGRTRMDPLAGMSQTAVLLARAAWGERKDADTGKVTSTRGREAIYLLGNFVRQKFAPAPGLFWDLGIAGEHMGGEEITPLSVVREVAQPLSLSDVVKVLQERGYPQGTALWIANLWGVGMLTHDSPYEKAKKKKLQAWKAKFK